jgi:lipopolysaccharide/colanic/teichoic acid biosynthesis glycosyltransferase
MAAIVKREVARSRPPFAIESRGGSGGGLTFSERLAVAREYVQNYSFCKDLKIMLQTVVAVGRGQGAF